MKDGSQEQKGPRRALASSQRAQWAWESVSKAEKQKPSDRKRYGTLARRLPALLQSNGTGQTLAFLYAKSDAKNRNAEQLLLENLKERLEKCLPRTATSVDILLKVVIDLQPGEYRLVSRELAASADWLKRMAEGKLEEEEP
jgi:CRISPR-associated protein Cmr5